MSQNNRVDIDGINVSTDHYIDGQRVTSPTSFEVRSPLDWSQKLADIVRGDQDTADAAISAAVAAFPQWAGLSCKERAVYLNRLADIIDDNIADLAKIECLDMAMLQESLELRVLPRGARNFRFYAEMVTDHQERVWSSNGTENRVIRKPAGPAVIITPWNAPFMLSTWKCAPALAAGNTVILKPAEWSPLSASMLADFIDQAGFPPGVFNIVQGYGHQLGASLVSDRRIKRISFTGSPETARKIAVAAAKNIIPFTAELGGKGAFIVFADADLDAAAKKAVAQFHDSGQVCLAGTRLLIEEPIYHDFLNKLRQFTNEQVLGDSRDPNTTLSPAIHPEHLAAIEGFIARARQAGDEILFGGKKHKEDGLWYEPTLIKPRNNDSEVVQKEIFGPVLTIQSFNDEKEAIELANSTPYGLSSITYTSSAERADRLGRALRAGTNWINCFLVRDLTAPFGGIGYSGIGREGGNYALDFHSDLITLQKLEGSFN